MRVNPESDVERVSFMMRCLEVEAVEGYDRRKRRQTLSLTAPFNFRRDARSAFDGLDLDGFDFDTELFEPRDGLFDFVAFPFERERGEADLVGDAALPDVGDDGELLPEFPDDRTGDELGREHEPEALLVSGHDVACGWGLASGDGGNDADFVGFLYGSGVIIEETDVFAVDEDVDETADVPLVVADPIFEAGEGFVEVVDEFADGFARGAHFVEIVREFAEGRGDEDSGHVGQFGWSSTL